MTIRDRSLKAASCHNLSDHARQCCVMALPEAGAHTRREKRRSCWWYRSDQRMITAGSMGDFQSEGFQKFGLSWHWPWKWVGGWPLLCLVTYVWDYCGGNLDDTHRQRGSSSSTMCRHHALISFWRNVTIFCHRLYHGFFFPEVTSESPWSPFHHSWNCHQQVGLSLMLVVTTL